jgi:FixJ family two-component response regulator
VSTLPTGEHLRQWAHQAWEERTNGNDGVQHHGLPVSACPVLPLDTQQRGSFVVDDDASLRASLQDLLESVGLRVAACASAQEFLRHPPPEGPSCLVLDVRLPGLSGLELQQRLATGDLVLPIIFITGHGDIPMSVQAMKAGAVDFLSKPFRDQDLLDAVHQALARDRLARAKRAERAALRRRFEALTPRQRDVTEGQRAADIIGRIRALAQKALPHKDWLDLNATIRDVLALARSEVHRHGVVIETHLAEAVPRLLGDRIQLQQVLLNLVINAIEAMSSVSAGPRTLWVSSELVAATEVLITVRDSGPGIDLQHLDRLFEAFYTTKPHGLGLGLAISRRIIEAHGGRLWETANVPQGAVVQFTVPIGSEGWGYLLEVGQLEYDCRYLKNAWYARYWRPRL